MCKAKNWKISEFLVLFLLNKIHFSKICIRRDRKVLNSVILQDALKVAQHVRFFKKLRNFDIKITAVRKQKNLFLRVTINVPESNNEDF
jgi:hypothetical protein